MNDFSFPKIPLLKPRRPVQPTVLHEDPPLSLTTFLEQEPDLVKEAGEYTREASGWAAGGQPTD